MALLAVTFKALGKFRNWTNDYLDENRRLKEICIRNAKFQARQDFEIERRIFCVNLSKEMRNYASGNTGGYIYSLEESIEINKQIGKGIISSYFDTIKRIDNLYKGWHSNNGLRANIKYRIHM